MARASSDTNDGSRWFKTTTRKRVALFVLLLFTGILAVTPPIVMEVMTAGPIQFSRVYTADEFGLSSATLRLSTSDGMGIVTHEVFADEPKAVAIFLSGIHNPSVTAFFGHAKMLFENGYSSLLVEMRAHGDSDGATISLGFKEYKDVQAAVQYIESDSKYDGVPIVVYGVSMGGATAINAIARTPQIAALISMSAYSSWEDAFCDNMVNGGAPGFYAALQKPFVKAYTTIKYGRDSYLNTPKDNIAKLGDRPALLIHSTDDSQVPFASFERLTERAPNHVETWVREGDLHFIVASADFTRPEKDREYYEVIIGFLDQHFGK